MLNNIEFPKKLIVEISTNCNFSCLMCPLQSEEFKQKSTFMSFDLFKKLEEVLQFIKTIVFSGFGEPLMNPDLIKMVEFARCRMPSDAILAIQTNGALLSKEVAEDLISAGMNKFCISVDTVKNSNLGHLSINAIDSLRLLSGFKDKYKILLGVETVITKDNEDELITLVEKLSQFNIDFLVLSHLIPYSQEMASKVSYDTNNKKSISIFKNWKYRLEEKGYSLNDWLDISKKMAGEGIEFNEEVYSLYKGMYEDAGKIGLTLNLNKLINLDESYFSQVEKKLLKIKEICSKKGIYYQIPGVYPESERKCDFLEEKCVFISVDGEVSPCYFLWHNFTCYISGLKKSVKKVSFGNINEKDIVEIYNNEGYKRFREAVLKYEFPYCYDCNFALCDLMELEDFIYDCYSNEIPCGACLWCGELFYCMI